jgi:mRNA-degrading endonuclease RelE of RelBE toxin-antitoxin system
MAFEILLTADAERDLDALRAYDHAIIVEAMETHLKDEPTKVSRARIKKPDQPAISQYRLRVGDYRVYYDVEESDKHVIVIQIYEKGRGPTSEKT